MDAILIRCKVCGDLFYANIKPQPKDVLDIIKYAKQGHYVYVADLQSGTTFALLTCTCAEDYINDNCLRSG